MGLLELIAKFDPFLHEHIKQYGNRGSGQTSYLSKTCVILFAKNPNLQEDIVDFTGD